MITGNTLKEAKTQAEFDDIISHAKGEGAVAGFTVCLGVFAFFALLDLISVHVTIHFH